ncbi:hypothetical protein, partial [Gemmatimonas sp.]|uniref:hypothetical protein n=1 Tax=Gemmatimonas sp. TaxID=1962908 RepID=UPI00391FC3B3
MTNDRGPANAVRGASVFMGQAGVSGGTTARFVGPGAGAHALAERGDLGHGVGAQGGQQPGGVGVAECGEL